MRHSPLRHTPVLLPPVLHPPIRHATMHPTTTHHTPMRLAAILASAAVSLLALSPPGFTEARAAEAWAAEAWAAEAWRAYVNARFGTSAEVPAEGFVADPPPENGDGRSWTSTDGKGAISVYGSPIVEGIADDVRGYRAFELESARQSGIDVTWQTGKADWFAYSGYAGDDIVYMKVVVTRSCGSLVGHHVRLQYPTAQRARWAPIVDRMARTLRGEADAAC